MLGSDALPTEERPASVRFGSDDKSKTELETKTKMVDYKDPIDGVLLSQFSAMVLVTT